MAELGNGDSFLFVNGTPHIGPIDETVRLERSIFSAPSADFLRVRGGETPTEIFGKVLWDTPLGSIPVLRD
jgi:hypothetical protein